MRLLFFVIKIKIETKLANYGAQKDKYLSSFITHVICDDIQDNSDYSEAKEVFELTVVKVIKMLILVLMFFNLIITIIKY